MIREDHAHVCPSKAYRETYPAGVWSLIECKVCMRKVVWVTFFKDGENVGVCACPWTTWLSERGKVLRSTLVRNQS